jgi:lincosamide nucleotidyltransferase A/C/D/E
LTATEVVEVLEQLEAAGIEAVLDGGWGVDALLGGTTRPHSDVDVVIDRDTASAAVATLARLGFRHDAGVVPGLPARYVLRDDRGRQVDLHLVVRDGSGNGWQPLDGGGWGLYPASELDARGSVAAREVRCISAELQLRHHLGFAWSEETARDMRRLAERFGLPLPPGISRSRE